MAALSLAERKVRTPQDKAPLNRRTPPLAGMASATESKHPNFVLGNRWKGGVRDHRCSWKHGQPGKPRPEQG